MDAIPARTFVDAIGINTHPSWRRTIWETGNWQTPLVELGVTNIRGFVGSGSIGRDALARLQGPFTNGIKLCATMAPRAPDFDLADIGANLDFLANSVGAANLCGIESANEYNSPRIRPRDWVVRLRHFQAWLYETSKANPKLRNVPVVGPSMWNLVTDDVIAVGNLEPYLDKACMHYYTGGRRPTRASRPPQTATEHGSGEYSLQDAIRQAKTQAPTKPMFVTEFGYALAAGRLAPSPFFITETAAAKYLLRGLLDIFAAGAEKVFIYTLVDDVHRDPPRYHGLLDGSLRPRKTFFAVRNFMRLLRDPRPPSAGRLDCTLDAPASIKRTLFKKSDGTFLLMMYQDVDSYDRRQRQDIAVGPVPVTLSLPRPASRIEVFTPTTDDQARGAVSGASRIQLSVGDHVTAVKIAP